MRNVRLLLLIGGGVVLATLLSLFWSSPSAKGQSNDNNNQTKKDEWFSVKEEGNTAATTSTKVSVPRNNSSSSQKTKKEEWFSVKEEGNATRTTKTSTRTTNHPWFSIKKEGNSTMASAEEQRKLFHSPVCNPTLPLGRSIQRIVLGHIRKAGGTTIKRLLKKVREFHPHLELVEYEGYPFEHPDDSNTHTNTTLFVSHVANPVKRAISHFKYDGRWPCDRLIKRMRKRAKKGGWEPTAENARPFEDWIHEKKVCRKARPSSKLWSCSSDCHIRWFNSPKGLCDPSSHDPDSFLLQRALRRSSQYDLIIHIERLADKHYVESIEQYFGIPAGSWGGDKTPMYCDKPSKAANAAFPLNITQSTLQLLQDLNQADSKFFHQLADCPNGIHFPKGNTSVSNLISPARQYNH